MQLVNVSSTLKAALDMLFWLQMPNRKLKMGLACSGILILGVAIPVVAIQFQKAKTAG